MLITQSLKLNSRVLARLRESYPRIDSPTPAQEALLLALDGEKDLFLRDAMGRGKYVIRICSFRSTDGQNVHPRTGMSALDRKGRESDGLGTHASARRACAEASRQSITGSAGHLST
jgi:hypothetical protein